MSLSENISVGLGSDIHQLVEGRRLVLGGVEIPFEKGLKGHSDADVLIHSVIDAILGAMGESDIGQWFSDQDSKYKDADSQALLEIISREMISKGYRIVNLDSIIMAEEPKIAPFKTQMKANLAKHLGVPTEKINIKAKTNEKLDAVGKKMAISAQCVVLLSHKA